MILAFRRPCADHRDVLLAFIDRREHQPGTAAALDHLDRCRECERELSATALAIAALRSLRRELEGSEPSPDAWMRLRSRIAGPVDPWRWRVTLGGLASSAMLVAVLVLPVTVGGPTTIEPLAASSGSLAELRHEAAYLASLRVGSLTPAPRVDRDGGSVPRQLPDEIAQVRKEVPPAKPSGRSPEPI